MAEKLAVMGSSAGGHLYEEGRHGLGLAEGEENRVARWFELAAVFLEKHLASGS
ncbi:hypothetical protein KS4_24160 [Poriferisphaera corsica]|uniref:Uncharacterized protein n=1 Tax=Poriferisphaera corsica TaxID=2528020 RepID=A0A517YVT7_9BACT|nr:hypothetical protein [Poriferisphaera corsica]QDU34348.1 hypothetical protein KS4_24160 [Poriferisphaera corsica]